MGFYDRLESISDNIDWFIANVVWYYGVSGVTVALIYILFNRHHILVGLSADLNWAKEEVELLNESIGDKKWPEAVYNRAAALAAVEVYREAYNKHKYFWMKSV